MNVKNVNDLEFEVKEDGVEKKAKRKQIDNGQNITIVNDYIRFVTMSDGNRSLQILRKYDDGTEEFVHDGWFGYKDDGSMFRNIISLVRDTKLKQKEVSDLKYYNKCWEDAKDEITKYYRVEF